MTETVLQAAEGADIFDTIRSDCAAVAAEARHVIIRHDRLSAYADALPAAPPANVLDGAHHYTGTPENMASYILTLDAINFGSGYEPSLTAEGWRLVDHSIYYTISTALKRRYEERGAMMAAALAAVTPADAAALLGLGQGPSSEEFALLCAQSMAELGRTVAADYGGSFMALVGAARGRVGNLVSLLTKMHHFNDVHAYRGRRVAFYKRAQITAADLHLAFDRKLFSDIGRLTMFPDNGVAHVFHMDGILEYTPDLATGIARGDEIPSGSEEEIEIRACALHGVELIAALKGMKAMDVDHILWHRSVEDARYRETPSHRTRSRFY